ncbi:MAG: hypothetical protein ACK57D_07590 [Sphingobacteriales bacterium]|jgi:uncharacterized membrane protein YoaK (UPF0700 family)
MSTTDYSNKTLEELTLEEKKLKKNRIFNALWIGFLVGIMVYRLATRGFGFIAIAIPVALLALTLKGIHTQNQNLAAVKQEIDKRNVS